MSCSPCDKVQEENDVTYVRIGAANVGVLGCDKHLREMFDTLDWAHSVTKLQGIHIEDSRRPIVRLKKKL